MTLCRCPVMTNGVMHTNDCVFNPKPVMGPITVETGHEECDAKLAVATRTIEVLRGALEDGLRRHEEFIRDYGLDVSKYPDAYIHVIRTALAAAPAERRAVEPPQSPAH